MAAGPLGRIAPEDFEHVEKYPLTASTAPSAPRPMVIGVNWYSAFDQPEKHSGHWWVARDGRLGKVRGGHCVALKHRRASDPVSWWDYYDQGSEGRCVQFGISRMMSQFNRRQYEVREDRPYDVGRWLYFEAQRGDDWPGGAYPGAEEFYEGTSVRSGLDVVLHKGIIRKGRVDPDPAEGIAAYRWATDASDALAVLGYSDVGYVDVLNSWGRNYPHLTRMPAEVLQRLLDEDGEIGVVTDR